MKTREEKRKKEKLWIAKIRKNKKRTKRMNDDKLQKRITNSIKQNPKKEKKTNTE